MGFAPAAVVDGPPRLPLPYGVFSVVSLAEATTERWESGVTWEALTCDPVNVVVGDCDAPEGFPKQFPDNGNSVGEASAFTVYGTYRCSGPDAVSRAQQKAKDTLYLREQEAVERRLWRALDDSPTVLTASGPLEGLARLEKFIGDTYGAKGVIHASRFAATVLAVKGFIEPNGSQMQTKLGTPVIVGSGYPGTGPGIDEVQTLTVTPAADQVASPSSGTYTLTFGSQTTAPIAYDATAATVQAALEALSNVEPGDVTVAGNSPMTITFGGQYNDTDVAQVSVDTTALVNVTATTGTTTVGGTLGPDSGSEYIAASPAIFGYRSEVFEPTTMQGDLMDRTNNDVFGIAERNYLLGMDPCGVAFVEINLLG